MTNVVSIAQSGANNVTMRNRIINGNMMIDQRNAGASVTLSLTQAFPVDRFNASRVNTGGVITAQRSTTAPSNFVNSILISVTTGVATAATDYSTVGQKIEGFNVSDFGWGTSAAVAATLSFWVRSSITGTYGFSIQNASAYSFIGSYTVNVANTWEYKTISIPAPTTSTFPTDNSASLYMNWDLGVGSTYSGTAGSWTASNVFGLTGGVKLSATSGATFYITGVQLEKGSTATPFEQRLYGTELALCQRYYEVLYANSAGFENMSYYSLSASYRTSWVYKVQKRASASTALGSGASWIGATPTIYEGISASGFYHASTTFYVAATAGTIALQASAEL